jgi:trehalose 6-phosphate synthase/phosphatase
LLFLDYDGTLVMHNEDPEEARPGKKLLKVLENILALRNTRVVIISGRNRKVLEKWFGHLSIDFAAEHGLFIKEKYKTWRMLKPISKNWKKKILPILHKYEEKLPGAFIEDKEYSVAFHYRKAEPLSAAMRIQQLIHHLENFISSMDIQILKGSNILEVRNAGIDKGVAALLWLQQFKTIPEFLMAIGDDVTDEDLFRVMPDEAYTIKVGTHPSYARYNLDSPEEVFNLLTEFSKS